MSEYMTPGVFIEDTPNAPIISSTSPTVGAFLGIAQRGRTDKPVFVTSWSSYIKNFAYGMESPFLAYSDLAYAVYGFFQNGGSKCYVKRVASDTATVAEVKVPAVEPTLTIKAKDAGTWGNNLVINIAKHALVVDSSNFDVEIVLNGEKVEQYSNLSNDTGDETYWVEAIRSSNFIADGTGALSVLSAQEFTGGADGYSDIEDADFSDALTSFDTLDDFNMIAIPGQSSLAVVTDLLSYVENRKDVYAIIDSSKTALTSDDVVGIFSEVRSKYATAYYPWINVYDPLTRNKHLRACPPSGHVMGVYARTISERGMWKAPAGTEANVRGAISVTSPLTTADTDSLTRIGVAPIVPKANYGIVLWGARNMGTDTTMKYISDILLDMHIKKSIYNGTQPYVFEPNDPSTWLKLTTTVETFLDGLWSDGALFGNSASEAYFVKCDEELNTPDSINQGKLICEIGYAGKKPSEFVIFRFSHEMSSN